MLNSECFLWDIEYPFYAYSFIFITILLAWQVTRTYQQLKLEPKRSCCRHHRKVRQRARDAASTARRLCQEEAEKPRELLSIMKSQSWQSVRQLLCVNSCCQICDAATLEIQQLLESEKSQISSALLGLSQGSSCLEMLSTSSASFEQNMELYSRHPTDFSVVPVTATLPQPTGHLTQSTNAVNVQKDWDDHLQLGPELSDMPVVSEIMASSRPEEPAFLVVDEEIIQNKPKLDQENQDHHQLKSSVSLLCLNPEITNLTHTMSLHMNSILPAHLPLLSPKAHRLLEVHVKKWIHFQKWGLPRRVEESLKQLMPDPTLFCRSGKNQLSSILNKTTKVTIDKIKTVSHQTKSSCLAGQPTQTCWVSEWSLENMEQINHWHQIQTYNALASQEFEPPLAQANDSASNFQKKYNQLFCGLPSLHSESLDATFLNSNGLSKNMSKPTSKDPLLLKKPSLFFLSKTPLKSALPPSPTSPNGKSSYEYEGAQVSVPFLTLDECEALECHLLQKQVKLQWGPPAVFLRSWYTQSHLQCEPHDKAQTPKTVKTSWPRIPFSPLTRELCFPEHTCRLLEFHLQKQLIHLRWGLPQKIQRSIQLFLSSTDQKPPPCSNRALPNVSISQPEGLKAVGSGTMFSPTVSKGLIPMPQMFAQSKAILQSHIDSKCKQVHQGKVPAHICSSWECRIPGGSAEGSPFPCISQGEPLKLQAESNLNLHDKGTPWIPKALDQEKKAVPHAFIEHCKRPQSLSKDIIKKLETILQHKYLAFLSGLPSLYCVALSRPTSLAVTNRSRIPEMLLPKPSKVLLKSCTDDDNKDSVDTAEKLQPELQVKGMMERTRPHSTNPYSNTHILAKLNFHMKKKVLAMQFGISEKENQFKEETVIGPKNQSKQKSLKSLNNQESTVLQKPKEDADLGLSQTNGKGHHTGQQKQATELQAVYHNQKQPDSAQWASKISQFSRDLTEAQMLCVDVEASDENSNLEELHRKSKVAENIGEEDAGLVLSQTNGEGHHTGEQSPEKKFPNNKPQGSQKQKPSFHSVAPCPWSPQHPPQPKFQNPHPNILGRKDSEHDLPVSESKVNVILKPSRTPGIVQPTVYQASQGHPFLGPPSMIPASPHKKPNFPESSWRSKMKSFLYSISPKMKGKTHTETMFSTVGKVTKTTKENFEKNLTQAKSSTKETETEISRGPKPQSVPPDKPVGTPEKLRLRSRQQGSASGPGNARHCPRHCPQLAHAAQHGN
uniref:Uncharacterized protein n=1 Tax=Nannospalax galili TaxID=1026970 RepID=A0A8C6RKH0_NANGA